MIYNYPYFGMPNYMNYMSQTHNIPFNYASQINKPIHHIPNKYHESNYKTPVINTTQYRNNNKNNNNYSKNNTSPNINKDSKNEYAPLFNILGISIHFDDLLLICVIFFLYNEKIEDNYLLLSLVLLLLS